MVVVVRNAERIRDMWHENVCEGLGKLGELVSSTLAFLLFAVWLS